MEMTPEERAAAKGLFLLTMKPILYVANVDEDMLNEDLAPIDGVKPLPICAKIEAELSELDLHAVLSKCAKAFDKGVKVEK